MVATAQLALDGPPRAHGSCRRCGRELSDPVSVQNGIGPICAGHAADRGQADENGDRFDLPWDVTARDIVCRRDADGTRYFNITPTHKHHSPTGFEWGYGGSGPADFALNIVACFIDPTGFGRKLSGAFDDIERVKIWDGYTIPQIVWDLHQPFKRAFIAKLPEQGGTIQGDAIRAWLRERGVPAEAIR